MFGKGFWVETSLGPNGHMTIYAGTKMELRDFHNAGFTFEKEITSKGKKVKRHHTRMDVHGETGDIYLYAGKHNNNGKVRCFSCYQKGGWYTGMDMSDSLGELIARNKFKPWGPMWTWATYSPHTLHIPAPPENERVPPKSKRQPKPGMTGHPPIAKLQKKALTPKPKKELLLEAYEEPEQLQPNGFLVDMDDDNLAVLSFPLINEIYELLGRPNIGKMKAVMTVVAQACGYQDWGDAMAKATNDDGHLTKRYIISMGQKGSVKFLPK